MGSCNVANELFFEEVKQLLNEGKNVHIRVRGESMRPFLHTDDLVLLVPASTEKPKVGQIVLANTADRGTVLHRIYRMNNKQIYLMGDGNLHQQEVVSKNDILGVATHFSKRNGHKRILLYTTQQRIGAFLWRKLLFCRKELLFILKNTLLA